MSNERRNALQRIRRKKTGYKSSKKYEKTKKGFLMRAYRNMLSRVRGIQRPYGNHHGLEILDKQEFYDWALNNEDFHNLFKDWEISKYDRKLTPSVDRIDPRFGYYKLNMQFITHSENSSRGNVFTRTGRIV